MTGLPVAYRRDNVWVSPTPRSSIWQEIDRPFPGTKEVMRDGLNGIVSESYAAFERRSDRPEYKAPAFQSLFHLILKVVYKKLWTIVWEFRWPK